MRVQARWMRLRVRRRAVYDHIHRVRACMRVLHDPIRALHDRTCALHDRIRALRDPIRVLRDHICTV